MCRYRYYYYATCRHQEIILFDFCADAQSLPDMHCASDTLATMNTPEHDMGGAMLESEEGGSTEENSDDLPSICSTTFTHTSRSAGSSFDTGSTSITAEPSFDCSSLEPADHLSHSSVAASHEMASLPIFGGTFRHWMAGAPTTAPKQSNVDSKGHVFMSSKRSVEAVSISSSS